MTLLNTLHELINKTSVQHQINLPEIVVVGDQSSGKSSLLQSIIQRDILPRGGGIVTKCPLRLSVHKSDSQEEFAVFPEISPDKIPLSQVRDTIKTMNDQQSQEFDISGADIKVDIYSPKMVSMTLVDLPGMIQNADDEQSAKLRDEIEKIVTSRISHENSIILAVCSSAAELNDSVSLRKAREADPELKRTLLVFTKMDICQDKESVLTHKIKTGLGHVGVFCESQGDINENIDFDYQAEKEVELYTNDEVFNKHLDKFGMNVLRKKLVKVFKQHVIGKLPEIQKKIFAVQERLALDINRIGDDYSNVYNYLVFAQENLNLFYMKIDETLEGKNILLGKGNHRGGLTLRLILEKASSVFDENEAEDIEISKFKKKYKMIYNLSKGLEGISMVSISVVKEAMKLKILGKQNKILEEVSNCKLEMYTIYKTVFNQLFSPFNKFKSVILEKIDEVLENCKEKTCEKVKEMLMLEYQTLECDRAMIDDEDPIGSLIKNLYEESIKNISRNFGKLVKF